MLVSFWQLHSLSLKLIFQREPLIVFIFWRPWGAVLSALQPGATRVFQRGRFRLSGDSGKRNYRHVCSVGAGFNFWVAPSVPATQTGA